MGILKLKNPSHIKSNRNLNQLLKHTKFERTRFKKWTSSGSFNDLGDVCFLAELKKLKYLAFSILLKVTY